MNKIIKLDNHLMNMIAAGEVVERPAGIVKELVENAIDANAKNIEINIINGGIDYISVLDDGEGMSESDVLLAFERHATSKIIDESDLFEIKTLGFRGEAIPSIASVSKVELTSNNKTDSTKVIVEYGNIKDISKVASNQGTLISVSGLFHKTPARLKNFKSVNYEKAVVISNVEKFALAYPNISFTLLDNHEVIFKTSGNNDLIEVMYQIYGRGVASNSFTFSNENSDFKISGVLVVPSESRSNRNYIQIFINNRMIRSYRLVNDVIEAYKDFMFLDRFPIAVIKLEMDYQLVDVNVHPSKWEVRINKEFQLSEFVQQSIFKALSDNVEATKVKHKIRIEEELIQTSFDDYKSEVVVNDINKVEFVNEEKPVYISNEVKEVVYVEDLSKLEVIGQMHGKYILAQDAYNLFIIDQHAAEERYNYELINEKIKNNIIETQELLIPEHIEISSAYRMFISDVIKLLNNFGIIIEEFSNNSIIVREVPLWLIDKDIVAFVLDIFEYVSENRNVSLDDLRKDTIASKACKASIKFNHILSKIEMKQVIINLSSTKQPYHCPHGRPTLIKISEKQLIKEFLR